MEQDAPLISSYFLIRYKAYKKLATDFQKSVKISTTTILKLKTEIKEYRIYVETSSNPNQINFTQQC